MKNKLLSMIISLSLVTCTLTATACKKGGSDVPETVVEKLELEDSSVVLTLGDVIEMGVSYNELIGENLQWSSSNPSVASVDENGFVEAKNVGSAIITVSYGTKVASCKVQVSTNGNLPVLAFDNDVDETQTLSLCKNTSFGFGTHIVFNGKTFDDGVIEYSVSNSSVGQVVNGEFVTGETTGETDVTVYATWRNQLVSSKTIKVRVVSDKTVVLNNGEIKDIKLYTAQSHEGKEYKVAQTLTKVDITEDGTVINDYTVSVLDNNIATVEKVGNEWKITALKVGRTYAVVSYNGVDGKTDVPFALTVDYPVAVYEGKLMYSVKDGKLYNEEASMLKTANEFFDGFGDITTAKINGKEVSVTDNLLKNISEGKDQTFTVYNGMVGYEITADAYTMVFDELTDFENIYASTESTVVTGTYVLAKDLISPNTVLTMPEGKVPADFGGVFDGMGHVVSCTLYRGEVGKFGLFGCILCGATIRNLAIDNTTIDGNMSTVKVAGVICSEPSQVSSTKYSESTLENMYVNVKFSSAGQVNLALMGNVQWNTVLKNVIVVAPEVPTTLLVGENEVGCNQYGSLARGATKKTTDSYVISSSVIYYTKDNPSQTFTPVPEKFDTYSALKNSGKDFSTFSPDYWDLSNGVPVWHSLVENFTLGE